VQVDAFQLAVETPSPQVQQRRRNAADTPLGIGLAALGITDALIANAIADGVGAEADELAGIDADRTRTADPAEPGVTSEAASDALPSDQDVTSPALVADEVGSMVCADASHPAAGQPDSALSAAPEEAANSPVQQDMSVAAGPELDAMPANEGEPAHAPAVEPEPSSQPGGAMALGLSRRRSSMVAPAPVAVTASRCCIWPPTRSEFVSACTRLCVTACAMPLHQTQGFLRVHVARHRRSAVGTIPPPPEAAAGKWRASRRLSSSTGVRMSAGAAAVPAAAGSSLPVLQTSGAGGLVQRLSGRIGLGGGLSRLSLSITDALRQLSIRSAFDPCCS